MKKRTTVNLKVRPEQPLRSNQRQVGIMLKGDEDTVMTMLNFLETVATLSMESPEGQWVKVRVDSEVDELEVTIDADIETLVSDTLQDALNTEHDMLLVDEAGVHPYPPPKEDEDDGDGSTESEE